MNLFRFVDIKVSNLHFSRGEKFRSVLAVLSIALESLFLVVGSNMQNIDSRCKYKWAEVVYSLNLEDHISLLLTSHVRWNHEQVGNWLEVKPRSHPLYACCTSLMTAKALVSRLKFLNAGYATSYRVPSVHVFWIPGGSSLLVNADFTMDDPTTTTDEENIKKTNRTFILMRSGNYGSDHALMLTVFIF